MIVINLEPRPNSVMGKKPACDTRVFTQDDVDGSERFQGPHCNIGQIADGGRHAIKTGIGGVGRKNNAVDAIMMQKVVFHCTVRWIDLEKRVDNTASFS